MTHRLSPLSPLDALYDCAKAYPGGVEALASRMRMPESSLYKKLCAHTTSHKLTFQEAQDLLRCFAEARMPDALRALDSIEFRFGRICLDLAEPEEESPDDVKVMTRVVRVFKECGDIATAAQEAAIDGRFTDKERERVIAESEQAIKALTSLMRLAMKKEGR